MLTFLFLNGHLAQIQSLFDHLVPNPRDESSFSLSQFLQTKKSIDLKSALLSL